MKLFFISIVFIYLLSATINATDAGHHKNTGAIGNIKLNAERGTNCPTKGDIDQNNSHLINKCSCDSTDKAFEECLIGACTDKCTSDIKELADGMHGCTVAKNNLNSTIQCSSSCRGKFNFLVTENTGGSILQGIQESCAEENKDQLQADLAKSCKDKIGELNRSRGAKLICRGNDCNDYCDMVSRKEANGCEDMNTSKGYQKCKNDILNAMNLPINPSHLPNSFSWGNNKCDIGSGCEREIAAVFNKAQKQCQSLKNNVFLCCDDPLKCMDTNNQQLFNSLSKKSGLTVGISEHCRRVKEKLGDIGKVAQKMATRCEAAIVSCQESCGVRITESLQVFNRYCSLDLSKESSYDRNKHTCSRLLISRYIPEYMKLSTTPVQCKSKKERAELMVQSAEESLRSALSAAKCEEQARAGGVPATNQDEDRTGIYGSSEERHISHENTQHHGSSLGVNSHTPSDRSGDVRSGTAPSSGATVSRSKAVWPSGGGGYSGNTTTSGSSYLSSSKESFNKANKEKAFFYSKEVKTESEGTVNNTAKDKDNFKAGPTNALKSSEKNTVEKQKASQDIASANDDSKKGFFSFLKKKTEKEKTKEDKKELSKKKIIGLRKYASAETAKDSQDTSSYWTKIKPRSITEISTSKYGSPHDNIFHRISTRIKYMCKKKMINCQ